MGYQTPARDHMLLIRDLLAAGTTWPKIAAAIGPDVNGDALRKGYYRLLDKGAVAEAEAGEDADGLRDAPTPRITGTRAEELVDRMALWQAAEARFERERAAAAVEHRIEFSEGPVCITGLGDLHCGGAGVDYALAREHAEVVAKTPGMYAGVLGDLADNFIYQWAMKIRLGTETTIPHEWHLVRLYLSWIAPKLLFAVDGNHDAWTRMLAGIDYFRDVVASARPDCLYANDDLRFTLSVDGCEWPNRVRHKWRGTSIYNPTHGQERASLFDHDFLVAWGAHTHTGSFVRTFNAAGRTGVAAQVNTYKVLDRYVAEEGFTRSTHTKPACVIFDGDGGVMATTDIAAAARAMRLYYRGRKAA